MSNYKSKADYYAAQLDVMMQKTPSESNAINVLIGVSEIARRAVKRLRIYENFLAPADKQDSLAKLARSVNEFRSESEDFLYTILDLHNDRQVVQDGINIRRDN